MPKQPHTTEYTIDEVVSGKESVRLTPYAGALEHLSLLEDRRPFTYTRYAEEIHPPVALKHINTDVLNQEYPRCLDMPIRLAGSEDYALPVEWESLAPLITDIISNEHAHNLNWQDYYTYITVDCKHVEPNEQQRHGGLHVDGFQGERITEKTKITRNYVMTTNGGTRFYPQRFIVADPAKFNVFQGFDLQAETFNVADVNTVYFMDAYTVHESGIAVEAGLRTFLRVTFDLKEFDRLGNTHNNTLDYEWDMVARTAQQDVQTPHLTDIEASPYFPNPNE